MNPWLKFGIPVVVVFILVVVFNRQLTVTVPVAEATTGTAVNAVTGTVEVLAYVDIRVKAQSRGTITENKVQAGALVEADQVIALQDSEELDLRIEQARIRLEAADARTGLESTHRIDLESIDEELKGVTLAVDLKQAPLSKLENLQRERRKREVLWKLEDIQESENLRLLQNQLEQLLLQKDYMTTKAPFAGTIAEVNAFKGDLVNGGQNLVRLVSHGRSVLMELTEEDYFGVKDGQPVTLRLASYPDRTFEGTVKRLEDVANSKNKTRNVFVEVDAADTVLVPGLTGEGYLVKDERTNAILIPRRALIGNMVFVVSGGKVDVRRVKPGFLGLKQAEILEGIEVGDLVILEDQNLLKPGDRVEASLPGQN
jgi:RND family efflux transporter MFP subunit